MWFKRDTVFLRDLPFTHDVHAHILPNVDDGFREVAASHQALLLMRQAGITHVALTPHVDSSRYTGNTFEGLPPLFERFKASLPASLDMHLTLASEYMCEQGLPQTIENEPERPLLCFKDRSVLIEMSYYYPARNIKELIYALVCNDYKPILAHPERYLYLAQDLEQFEIYRDMRCRLQLNMLSLSGAYGPPSVRIYKHLLQHNAYSFVGSDLHSVHQWELIRDIKIPAKMAPQMEELLNNNQRLF